MQFSKSMSSLSQKILVVIEVLLFNYYITMLLGKNFSYTTKSKYNIRERKIIVDVDHSQIFSDGLK